MIILAAKKYRLNVILFNLMKVWLLTISIFYMSDVFSQQVEGIEGKIVDYKKRPLPYASIRLKNTSIGVVSNLNGDFRLPLRKEFLKDTLIVSHIGYVTRKLPITMLKSEGSNIIELNESQTMLPEIAIHAKRNSRLTGKRIVAAAISNININYPMYPFTYVAYYRDYQIKENNYTNLNEAIVRVADKGFNTNDQIQTKIELMQYKVNSTFPIDTFTTIPYDNWQKKFIPQAKLGAFGGNELAILRVHDALRNYTQYSYSFVGVLNKDFIRNHSFTLSRAIGHNDIQLYEIKFNSNQVTEGDSHFSKGVLYIEAENYKIHKMEYSMYDKSLGSKLIYNIKVEYRDHADNMYLNYISFNNEFKVRDPDDFRVLDTKILSDVTGFSVVFSHPVDSVTATDKNNYKFSILGKKVELDTVLLSGRKGTQVIAYIKNSAEYGLLPGAELAKHTTANYSNIKDRQNRTLNVMTFIQATQYREIFVQRIEPKPFEEVKGIDKFIPLNRAVVTANMRDFADYWMNTPLKSKLE